MASAQVTTILRPLTTDFEKKLVSTGTGTGGDELEAMRLYDQAIEQAHKHEFLHHEALANELCAKFHLAAGRLKIARTYMTDAYYGYTRWGAMAKSQDLLDKYPHLLSQSETQRAFRDEPPSASTAAVPAEVLDTEAMVRAAQAIAGELVFEKVLERLMRLTVQNAGARRAVLILVQNEQLMVEATITVDPDVVSIGPRVPVERCTDVPLGIVYYVRRTEEPVVLGDATSEIRFAADPYIVSNDPKSILCLAMVRQGRIMGLLYLENNIVAHAFTKGRVELCGLLTSQAAIAVENAQLVLREQHAREAAEEAERRAVFLAEAGVVLSESLVLEQILARLARLCVGSLADWCVIDVLVDGELRRAAGAHSDPGKEALIEQLQRRFPLRQGSPHPAAVVLRTGQPLLIANLSDAILREHSESDEHAELVRALGTRTALVVPLLVRGHPVGTLSIGSAAPGRCYGKLDLDLAQELSRRAAIAVDNARLYRASQEAIQLREEFLAVASHELRTPLTPLRLQLQRLQRTLSREHLEKLAHQVDTPLRQADRLTALVANLLDVVRIKSGHITLYRRQVDLSEMFRRIAADYRDALRLSECTLQLKANVPVVGYWDEERLDQVAIALLSNAIKYGSKRPILVIVAAEGQFARLSVRDFGIGIAPADRERIFERFERAVPVHHYGGLGLGLYIAQQIVRAHHGSIRVESEPGAGATFIVELPIEPREEAAEGVPQAVR